MVVICKALFGIIVSSIFLKDLFSTSLLTLKALGFFFPGARAALARGGGNFLLPLCKIKFKHLRESTLTQLIAYIMFYKICKFGSSAITNDVIMTSLPKQCKIWASAKPNKLHIIPKALMRAFQKCTFH